MTAEIPNRSEVAAQYKWNAESVFPNAVAWEREYQAVVKELPGLAHNRQRLSEGPGNLLETIRAVESLIQRAEILIIYAGIANRVDTTDQEAAERWGMAQVLAGQSAAAAAFLGPSLLALGGEQLDAWFDEEPALEPYRHFIDNLLRGKDHVRSAEVEELLGMLQAPFLGPHSTASALSNSDFSFKPATDRDGDEIELTQGSKDRIKWLPDRVARRTAWQNYADQYLAYKNTLASNLFGSIQQNAFSARARRYESTIDAALFVNNIPRSVFDNLIRTFEDNLPTWHRYWAFKKEALGVEILQPYDVWAPLSPSPPEISYEQAVDWLCAGLAPLGEDYVAIMRRGALEDRWIDVYPNQGKNQGAFSWGTKGMRPFIVMSFNDDVSSLSTLAHELGHSMHSYLAWEHHPYIYNEYSIFVAEVASNFHQALLRAHLLDTVDDPALQISLIEEAMSNFHRYFLIMPTLAKFELEMHEIVERGGGLAADGMIARCTELFSEAYGPEMDIDQQRMGITWAQFNHLYQDYYVYQYATGISAAHALAERVLAGGAEAAADYVAFLKAGGSVYPLDALMIAGVDMNSPGPVETTFEVMAGYIDRLEELVGQRRRALS